MKSFFISLIIAALLCTASIFYSYKLKGTAGTLLNDTQTICTELENNEFAAAKQSTKKLIESVHRLEPFLSAFGDHSEITAIEGCLAELEVYSGNGDRTEALARARYLTNLFKHIPENLSVRLENVL